MHRIHSRLGRGALALVVLIVAGVAGATFVVLRAGRDPVGHGPGNPDLQIPAQKFALTAVSRGKVHLPHYSESELQSILACLKAGLPRTGSGRLSTAAASLAAQFTPTYENLEQIVAMSSLDASLAFLGHTEGASMVWTATDPTVIELASDGSWGRQWPMEQKSDLPDELEALLAGYLPEGMSMPTTYYQTDSRNVPDFELVQATSYAWAAADAEWELLPQRDRSFWGEHPFSSPRAIWLLDASTGLPYRWSRHHASSPSDPAATMSVRVAAMSLDQLVAWLREVHETGVVTMPQGIAMIALEDVANDGELTIDSSQLQQLGYDQLGPAFAMVGLFTTVASQTGTGDGLTSVGCSVNVDVVPTFVVNVAAVTGEKAQAVVKAVQACQPK